MSQQLAILILSIIIVTTSYDTNCDAQGSPACVPNSSPHICGTICEPSCTTPKPKFYPRIACTKETRGCRCDNGFLRDEFTKQCVSPFQCTTCPPDQALLPCGTMCEGTCDAPYEPERCQYIRCLLPGCGCDLDNNMVRNNSTDMCIPMWTCPQHGDGTMDFENYEDGRSELEVYEDDQCDY